MKFILAIGATLLAVVALAQSLPPIVGQYGVGGPLPATCKAGESYLRMGSKTMYICWTPNNWLEHAPVPPGSIVAILSGTCAPGWTEVAALDGVTLEGTLAAHGDVGTAVGSFVTTPMGTSRVKAIYCSKN